jgi:hypothetical protein
MALVAAKILIGFVVGTLIGLTGWGRGIAPADPNLWTPSTGHHGGRLRRSVQLLHQNSRQHRSPEEGYRPTKSGAGSGRWAAFPGQL